MSQSGRQAKTIKIIQGMVGLSVLVLFMIPIVKCTNFMMAPTPTVSDLKASVSLRGMVFTIENQDSFDWTACGFTVNPAGFSGNGFDANIGNIAAHASREIESTALAAADGTRFDLFTHKVKSVLIECSTPAGGIASEGLTFTG
jgi:hypothetical protein